jgi:hypothetical protein
MAKPKEAVQERSRVQVKAEHRADDLRLLSSGRVSASELQVRNGFASKLDLSRAKVVGHRKLAFLSKA